ncbi:MAG: flagellar biosynthetic protein FliR [Mesorhizobium sp.]
MIASLPDLAIAAFIAFCRIGGCFLVMPGLSSVRVPMQVRLFVAVAATFALLIHLWDDILPYVNQRPDALILLVLSETLVGALIGMVARLYVQALQFIGTAMATMIGYNGQMGTSIEGMEPEPALAALLSFSALLVLFLFNFHHEIVKALVNSYKVVPLNVFFNPQSALVDVTDTVSESFMVMLRLGSPFIAYGLLVNLAIGFINKLTPQIPVYFISLPFVIAGGLILFYFGVSGFLSLFADGFLPTTIAR